MSSFPSSSGADPNVRDYGGRRPVDILSNKANERARSKSYFDDHYQLVFVLPCMCGVLIIAQAGHPLI